MNKGYTVQWSFGPHTHKHFLKAKRFGPGQPTRTAQAALGQYVFDMHDIEYNQLVIFDMKNISRGCVVRRWKNECAARVFLTPYDASEWDIFHIKNNQLIILFIIYLIKIIIFKFSIYKCLMKKKVVPTLRQEMKVKVDIVTSDDIKIYYTGKFQDFTARYIIKSFFTKHLSFAFFFFYYIT